MGQTPLKTKPGFLQPQPTRGHFRARKMMKKKPRVRLLLINPVESMVQDSVDAAAGAVVGACSATSALHSATKRYKPEHP